MESTVSNAAVGEGADKCYICLSPFEKQIIASLENCQHVFCIDYILQWSQTSNTCPVDRVRFAFILQRRHPGGAIQKKIKVRTAKVEDEEYDEEEEGSNRVMCEECGRSDRRHRLLMCIHCDSGYHMDCLTPSLNTCPEGDWVCAECAVTPQHTDGSVVEGEISDGELTDLLVAVDETASTSSRLRPSTLNRPRSSADRRHSQRIQSRASGNPHPLPQTSWHVPRCLLRATQPAAATVEVAALHHRDINSAAVELKTRKRRKRAT
ncbi:PHD and RING finger domain-containing protein 1-like [Pseudoliparis swirei]|uniref:PHD and RING finger domain-containing protein 1-like n=1 Tax=Pseudoliparis swirei TaxID=2059687 RepID=UPI0024BDBA26|nr:PHD and RING finger domain-containing protein 1-like [Pseudoliparis swirei]